jgi:hypothetical protein
MSGTIQSIYKKGDYTFESFNVSKEDKYKYGEIYTPFSLIERMFKLFNPSVFKEKNKKWLDTGAGIGNFSIYLYKCLMDGLAEEIPNEEDRDNHIIRNMIYMVEIKESNVIILRECFGEHANILCEDYTQAVLNNEYENEYDYIIGNPPYNSDGIKKVPTNKMTDKKEDGKTIWVNFIHRSISLLHPKGKLLYIVPSIWMKPDKAKTYDLLTKYKLEKIVSLNNTETNKIFKGNAQTPTCYFLLSKEKVTNTVTNTTMLYDKNRENFTSYTFDIGKPIPVFGSHIINKLVPFVKKYGCLKPIKTNLPNNETQLSLIKDDTHPYPNIKTCITGHKDNTNESILPTMVIEYSNILQPFSGVSKLILAHKMYGFPYLDASGTYGITNRDNYVFENYSIEHMKQLHKYLSTKTALYLYESTRYRMKYLERYAFEFIPDITKIPDFPHIINDNTIAEYFCLDDEDKKHINKLHKKEYSFSVVEQII